jgi:hypothetical protein
MNDAELINKQPPPFLPDKVHNINFYRSNSFRLIFVALVILLIGGAIGYSIAIIKSNSNKQRSNKDGQKGCTLEVKICPDGSSVGRSGSNCEFAPCPTTKPTPISSKTTGWIPYTNEKYNFEFSYPQNFKTTEGLTQHFLLDENPLVELISEGYGDLQSQYQVEANYTVSVKLNAKSDCEYIPQGVLDTIKNKEINGIPFTIFSTIGVAAGNEYSNNVYHYLSSSNTCYELVTTIHESIGGNPQKEEFKVRKSRLENQLDQILTTFKFVSSANSDEESVIVAVNKYLTSIGLDPATTEIVKPTSFSNDVYSVSYKPKGLTGTEAPYILVGKIDNRWVVATGYDGNYCRWIRESNADENTKAFMGYTDHCQ